MSVNTVTLVGYLGGPPELRKTQTGLSVCNLRIATNNRGKGEESETVDWHRIVVWGEQAETCHRYLTTGRLVAVEGRLRVDRWEDDKGEKRRSVDVVARRVTFLGGKPEAKPEAGSDAVDPVASLPF